MTEPNTRRAAAAPVRARGASGGMLSHVASRPPSDVPNRTSISFGSGILLRRSASLARLLSQPICLR